ncbi:MAG: MBL fold metallo-hydrolase [Patescibacteria group bacterium]|nr:MBL fold metallo-hydrolase [Patescibacteria group bacterium]
MTSLTFHGGISTIGGNCVIIEESNTRIMFDNGMCFSSEGAYYKDFSSPRTNNDLRDYLKLGLIPEIPGIYGKEKINDVCLEDADPESEYLFKADLISYEDYMEDNGAPYISALFLTHAHLDHVRNIMFMAPEIPIYCSEITKRLLEIICDTSDYDFFHYSYHEKGERSKNSFFPGSVFKKKCKRERFLETIVPNEPMELPEEKGLFKIEGYPVDHSVPGAMAFKVTTKSGKTIIYTGDIRFHGHDYEKKISDDFVKKVGSNPDILISEGTRIGDNKEFGESDVYHNISASLKKDNNLSKKLIIASFPWKSISRFVTVHQIAKDLKRVLVIQPKLAYTIHNLQDFDSIMIKGVLKEDTVKIFLPRKYSMIYSDDDYKTTKYHVSYDVKWPKNQPIGFYSAEYGENILVRACDIKENPSDYLLHLNFYELNELIDICPPKDSYFFNLKTEPFDEEGELEEKVLMNWISKFSLQFEGEKYHASGHAPGIHIREMINKIRPMKIFPIHTEKPELFKYENAETHIIKGQKYFI